MWWERLIWCHHNGGTPVCNEITIYMVGCPHLVGFPGMWLGAQLCLTAPVYSWAPHQLNFIWTPHNIWAPLCIVLWPIGRSTIYRRLGAPTIYVNNQSHMGATIAHRAPMRGGAPLYMVAVHIYRGARSGACIYNWLQPHGGHRGAPFRL